MIILISGIPGTGKTFIGNYLEEHYGFQHTDLESQAGRATRDLLQRKQFKKFLREVSNLGNLNVLTFGYPPEWLHLVEQIARRGVKTIWFDAPILFSRKYWHPEFGEDPISYNLQLSKIIDNHESLNTFYANRKICVCSVHGDEFLPATEIISKILDLD